MRVSVVMATRNPELKALREAMDSVYSQTYKDIELIIVDDGSDQPVIELIKPLINESVPTRVFRIEPSGLGAALNHGIEHAKGEYIARIDDDDIMLPLRLAKQVEYLDNHPGVSCVGSWFYDKVGNIINPHRKYPTTHKEIVRDLLSLKWGLAHTSVMYRKESFMKAGGYRISGGGQDLDLFLQLASIGQLANVDEYLTCYTMSSTGLGTVNPKKKDAYLFALRDVVNRNIFPDYITQAERSIKNLTSSINPQGVWLSKVLRSLLMMKIRIFGKKFRSN